MAQRKTNGDVEAAVSAGERIQSVIDEKDRRQSSDGKGKPMQAGAREYPHEFPAQHLKKPGLKPT